MHSDENVQFTPKLDLNELAKRHDLRLVIEPVQDISEREASHELARAEANHARRKDWLLFQCTLGGAVVLGLICSLIIILNPSGSDNAWPKATLTAMVTGILGYLFGRSGLYAQQQKR